jgi:DNA repair exonuclease SbcCD ATPase subunit
MHEKFNKLEVEYKHKVSWLEGCTAINEQIFAQKEQLRKDVKEFAEKLMYIEKEYKMACKSFDDAVDLNDKRVEENEELLKNVKVLEEKVAELERAQEVLKNQHLEAMRTEQSRLKKEIDTLCQEKATLQQAKSRLEACNEGLYTENQRLVLNETVRNEAERMQMQVPQILEVAAQNLASQALQAALDDLHVMQQEEPETIAFEQDNYQDGNSDDGATTQDCCCESSSDESETGKSFAQAPAASG